MNEETKKIVDALRCDSGEESNCDMCEYHTNGGCYGRLLDADAADMIERQSAEIDELREKLGEARLGAIWYRMLGEVGALLDENAHLKDQVYNLTMYLNFLIEGAPNVIEKLENDFSGMPGYNPAILEEKR